MANQSDKKNQKQRSRQLPYFVAAIATFTAVRLAHAIYAAFAGTAGVWDVAALLGYLAVNLFCFHNIAKSLDFGLSYSWA